MCALNLNISPSAWLCILEAVLTVSPMRQYRGSLFPMTPATTDPGTMWKSGLGNSCTGSLKSLSNKFHELNATCRVMIVRGACFHVTFFKLLSDPAHWDQQEGYLIPVCAPAFNWTAALGRSGRQILLTAVREEFSNFMSSKISIMELFS